MKRFLQSNNPEYDDERRAATSWFKEFSSDFNLEHAADLKLNKRLVDRNIPGLSNVEKDESETRISLILVVS